MRALRPRREASLGSNRRDRRNHGRRYDPGRQPLDPSRSTADLCRFGPFGALLFDAAALIVFVLLAAAVGTATGRAVGSVGQATLAGLLFGVIAGVALLLTVPFAPAVTHRLQDVNTLCPQTSAIRGGSRGSFAFSFGLTPPPGVVPPTPPPGFF